jgi:hypothetical protein
MAGNLSDYAENEILDHILKTTVYTAADNLYVGLSTVTIDDATTGGDVTEPSGGAYARVECNTWDAADARATENTGAINFAEATGDWGTITDWFVADSTDSGNIIAYGTFSSSKAVGTGDSASIAAGGIDVTVDSGGMSTYLANEILDHVFKTGAYTPATNLYVGLSDATIDDATTGGDVSEPSGGAYARVGCNTWDVAASGATENTAAITFTQATGDWGTITDFFIADSTDAGNILFYEAADASKAVGTDDTVQFDAGSFDITLD